MIVYPARDIRPFVMYCVNGKPRSSLLIESTDSMIVDSQGKAHWSQVPSFVTRCMSLDKSKLVELTEYLIDNVYVKAGNNVYRQNVSIPMETDCAPQLANQYLFYHEYSYMKSLLKTNLSLAKRFADTVRYIDDLVTLLIMKSTKVQTLGRI